MRMAAALILLVACGRSSSAPQPTPADRDAAVTVGAVGEDAPAAPVVAAPPAPAGTFLIVTSAAVPGKLLAAAPGGEAALTALADHRVALHGEAGRLCEATVGRVVPRQGCLAHVAPAADLIDVSGSCGAAMFALAPGATLRTTKVRKAPPALEDAADRLFEEGTGRMAAEKAALEGLSEAADVISTRALTSDGLRSLVLMYARIHGTRSIDAFGVGDDAELRELAVIAAPAPSLVLGADADGDGGLDAIVAHAGGVALIGSAGEVTQLACQP